MGTPYHHAVSSVKKFGGKPEDYQPLHDWFDQSKAHIADFRHRCYRHHTEGIFELERRFGTTITNSDGVKIPTRLIGEQHVREDLGCIPSLQDWFSNIVPQPWMRRNVEKLSELEPPHTEVRPSDITESLPNGFPGRENV